MERGEGQAIPQEQVQIEVVLIKPADQVEQQLSTGLGEGQIAQFVEDDELPVAFYSIEIERDLISKRTKEALSVKTQTKSF